MRRTIIPLLLALLLLVNCTATETPPADKIQETPVKTTQPTEKTTPNQPPIPTTKQTSPAHGLNISRNQIQAPFEELGFVFQKAVDVKGQPRVIAKGPNGLSSVEIIGPPDNITQATLLVGFPSDSSAIVAENAALAIGFLHLFFPNWDGLSDWLTQSIVNATKSGEAWLWRDDYVVEIIAPPGMGLVTITVTNARSHPSATIAAEKGLRVRKGPGTQFEPLGALPNNEKVIVLGRNEECTWLKVIQKEGLVGWVSASYVKYDFACEELTIPVDAITP